MSIRTRLKKNRWLVKRYRQFLIWKQMKYANFAFVHINKTGGSSIRMALEWVGGHTPANQRRKEYGEKLWKEKFTFAFVRNPYDRLVSQYHYRIQSGQDGLGVAPLEFRDWVFKMYGPEGGDHQNQKIFFQSQSDWICDEKGHLLVDFVGAFERLQSDFDFVCDRIGRKPVLLPHMKKSDRRSYREYYDDELCQFVSKVFADDLTRFDYAF